VCSRGTQYVLNVLSILILDKNNARDDAFSRQGNKQSEDISLGGVGST
jgi:hypothetical protein